MTSWVVVGVVTVRETVRTSLVSHMRIAWEPPAKPRPRGIEARRGRRVPRGLGTVVPGMVSERAATILVVDDDRAIADTVADGLAVAGHRTLRAATGAEALEVLRTQRPDLVILDVTMPHVDGWTVLETMRRRGLTTPVVMLTARHEREDVVRGLRLGADDYVAKPFGLEQLLLQNADLSCVPCHFEGCERHRESRSDCLDRLSPARVIAAAEILLQQRRDVPATAPAAP